MERKEVGRPGIESHVYVEQIQRWLAEGLRITDVTATMLQKEIGGQYRKASHILAEFKQGYETKELAELPDMPSQLSNALNAAGLELWRIVCEDKNKEIEQVRDDANIKVDEFSRIAEERLSVIDDLESQLQHAQDEIARLQPELDVTKKALSDEAQRASVLEVQSNANSKELAQLISKHEKTTCSLEAALVSIKELEAQNVDLKHQIDLDKLEHKQIQKIKSDEMSELVNDLNASGEHVKSLQQTIEELKADNHKLDKQLALDKAVMTELQSMSKKTADKHEVAINELKTEKNELQKQLVELNKNFIDKLNTFSKEHKK